MRNVAFFGYRDWALKIYDNLTHDHFIDIRQGEENIEWADILFYCGWSDIIPKEVYEKKLCLVLHPSPLPKYRGGSPIQHQIIAGEKMSAVTIFKATDKVDAGEIYSQTPFSLEGTLDDIFERIVEIGTNDFKKVVNGIAFGGLHPVEQDESQATYFKRRTPEDSEIFSHSFKYNTAEEIYNFIRMLADPYPNAFITCADGKKLYITQAHLESGEESEAKP